MKKLRTKNLSKRNRIIILITVGLIILSLGAVVSAKVFENNDEVYEPDVVSNYQPEEETSQAPSEEKPEDLKPEPESASQWPITYSQAESNSLTVVVNKKHKLPSDYFPSLKTVSGAQMRPEAADALSLLLEDAINASVPMKVLSSYRSYSTQVSTYNRWVSQSGQTAADTFSARPGHSEHQLGLAVDLGEQNSSACDLESCFGNTETGKWLASNAQNYGFIIRYPTGKDAITGYQYEPWHLRYIGNIATEVTNSGKTLDEYYGVAAGDYQ